MTMPTLVDFQTTLLSGLTAVLPCPVKAVGGAFGADELRRHVTTSPCVLLAVLRVTNYEPRTLGWLAEAACVAYVVTRDSPTATRDAQALTLVSLLLTELASANYGTTARLVKPTDITADNLYSGTLDSVAVALWGVTWNARLVAKETV